jgi:hypothetical protein
MKGVDAGRRIRACGGPIFWFYINRSDDFEAILDEYEAHQPPLVYGVNTAGQCNRLHQCGGSNSNFR